MGFSLRPCSESEAVSILRDPTIIGNFDGIPMSLPGLQTYVMNESVLIGIVTHSDMAEVHIAAPYRARGRIRDSLRYGMGMLKGSGYRGLFTHFSGEKKALANMLRNLGFRFEHDRWLRLWEWTQ